MMTILIAGGALLIGLCMLGYALDAASNALTERMGEPDDDTDWVGFWRDYYKRNYD